MPKFLIIRFSSIGDIVLTSPVIRCLKTQVPGAEVHFLTKKAYKQVLEHHPLIDRLWTTDGELDDVSAELKAQNFDYIIDLHHNLRSLKLKKILGVKSFSFSKLNIEKWLLVNLHIDRMPRVHIVDRYLKTCSSFGVVNDGKGLDFYTGEEARSVIQKLPPSHRQGYYAIAIGAQHSTKIIPGEKLSRIINAVQTPVILLGGKEDVSRGAQIEMFAKDKVWNACGRTSLGESAELIRNAKVVLTHDTGLMHIAAAFKKPVVSVWGNTVPAFGMYPYMPGDESNSKIIEVKGLACRPCTKIGFEKCPKGHFQCMRGIEDSAIISALNSFLKK